MTVPRIRFRSVLSFALVVSIASAFSLSSLAAASDDGLRTNKIDWAASDLLRAPTATLIASGEVAINGYEAQTGATVLSGSQISTRRNSIASVDLGPLGRVILRPDTSVQLTFATGAARIKTEAEHVRVVVLRGALSAVSSRGNYSLAEGQDIELTGAVELTPGSATVFTVQNQGQNPAPGQDPNQTSTSNPPPKKKRRYLGVPWWGYLAFAGVAGGIAAGIVADHDNGGTKTRVISNSVP
jgi:hypothetical protein